MKFYKGKYLIAIYDKNDRLIDVGCNANEITQYSMHSMQAMLSRQNSKHIYKRLFLIDVTKKHDDIFNYEDEVFLEAFSNPPHISTKELAQSLGISEHSFLRRCKALNLPHKKT